MFLTVLTTPTSHQGEHRVTVDTLTLGDLLARAERVAAHSEAIKALDAQAQGEGVIRKVLDEVEGWAVARGLATQPYTLTGTSTRCVFCVGRSETKTGYIGCCCSRAGRSC